MTKATKKATKKPATKSTKKVTSKNVRTKKSITKKDDVKVVKKKAAKDKTLNITIPKSKQSDLEARIKKMEQLMDEKLNAIYDMIDRLYKTKKDSYSTKYMMRKARFGLEALETVKEMLETDDVKVLDRFIVK